MGETILTGYRLIDNDLGGLKPGELTLIGGRPSMGKTSLALSIALNAAKSGKRVLFFSAECSPTDLGLRIISILSGIPFRKISHWDLSDEEWELFKRSTGELKKLPLHFFAADSLYGIRFWCREEKEQGIDLIIFDYLQLLHVGYTHTKDSTPDLAPAEHLVKLKKLAKKYGVPVIVLTQLFRKLERRKDKRPKLKDMRIEDQAEEVYDQVVFIYRDAYYDLDAPWENAELTGVCKARKIKKTCTVSWNWEIGWFEECIFR